MPFRCNPAFRAMGIMATLTVLALILYQSSQARGEPGMLELTTNEAYAGHFVIYGVMVFCAMTALGRLTLLGSAAILTFAVGLGAAMELYQAYEPTRVASSADAFVSAAGAAGGFIAYLMAVALLDPPRKQPTKS